jgi:diguanylate cyclase (GGDEF)-like protein
MRVRTAPEPPLRAAACAATAAAPRSSNGVREPQPVTGTPDAPGTGLGALPPIARWYVASVIVLGFFALLVSAAYVPQQNAALCALFLILSAFVSLAKIELRVPRSMSTLTFAYVANYMALLVVGPHVAALTAAAGAWSQCTFRRRHANPAHQTMFSMATLALAVYSAGAASAWFAPDPAGTSMLAELQSVVAGATVFFGVNSWLIAGAIAATTGQSVVFVWTQHFVASWPGFLLGAFFAAAGAAGIARSGLWIIPIAGVAAAFTSLNLRRQATRAADPVSDPLTGLANLGFLHSQAAFELTRARRRNSTLVLCVLDLDGFRAINEQLGHDTGDRALRRLAEQLNAAGGAQGICARAGGDEFAMLLPDRNAEDVRLIAGRVRAAVAWLELAAGPRSALAIGVGVAEFPRDGATLDELLCRADERLYQSKAARRPSEPRWSRMP